MIAQQQERFINCWKALLKRQLSISGRFERIKNNPSYNPDAVSYNSDTVSRNRLQKITDKLGILIISEALPIENFYNQTNFAICLRMGSNSIN